MLTAFAFMRFILKQSLVAHQESLSGGGGDEKYPSVGVCGVEVSEG